MILNYTNDFVKLKYFVEQLWSKIEIVSEEI